MEDTKVNDPSMNPRDNTKKLTWEDMKAFVEKLTPEQLKSELLWWGDERGGTIKALWLLDEDYYDDDSGEGLTPASVLDDLDSEDAEDYILSLREGTPMMDVD